MKKSIGKRVRSAETILSFYVASVFLGCLAAEADERHSTLMFRGDFETGRLNRFGDGQLDDTLKKVEIVGSPVRFGKHALKMTLDRVAHANMTGHRTDFWIKGMSQSFHMGEEYWYGFSKPDTIWCRYRRGVNSSISSRQLLQQ